MHHGGEDRPCKIKKVHFSSGKAKTWEPLSNGSKDLHLIINQNITAALSTQEKKDLNKFEALSILSGSDNGNNSDSNSRISNISDEDMNLECVVG
eukprot:1524681-Ditylum_brightwellii.AAC.1